MADADLTMAVRAQQALAALRARGWSVAVHNDYRLNKEPRTFWLFTHPNGTWAKGEGPADDVAALEEACAQANERLDRAENIKRVLRAAWLALDCDRHSDDPEERSCLRCDIGELEPPDPVCEKWCISRSGVPMCDCGARPDNAPDKGK